MCLICVSMGKAIPESSLENGWDENNDGAGFSFVRDNQLFIRKGYVKYKSFLTAYKELCVGNQHVVHFRKASYGTATKKELTHPFLVHKTCAVFYNGTIHGLVNNKTSDTELLAKILNGLPVDFVMDKKKDHLFNAIMYSIMGKNKMVFHSVEDGISIFNKDEGIDDCGIWYSNDSYKKKENKIMVIHNTSGTTDKKTYDSAKCSVCQTDLTEYDMNNKLSMCIKCRIDNTREGYCENCGHIFLLSYLNNGICVSCSSFPYSSN